jgi:hypothetical protein
MVKIEVLSQITDPREMAESDIYTSTEKADFYQRYLDRERSAGFKKLFIESENWPLDSRHALDEALAKTPKAIAYAARLSTDDQIKFLNRMLDLGYSDSNAAKAFVDVASSETLNNIALRFHELSNLGKRVNGYNVGSGKYFLMRMAERTGELSPDAQKAFAKAVAAFNIFEETDTRRNEDFRKRLFQVMFGDVTE